MESHQVISLSSRHHLGSCWLIIVYLITHLKCNRLTVNGWVGFLSRISQDSRMEFFMAAFTLKLVAKTESQKTKTKRKNGNETNTSRTLPPAALPTNPSRPPPFPH